MNLGVTSEKKKKKKKRMVVEGVEALSNDMDYHVGVVLSLLAWWRVCNRVYWLLR